MLKMQEKKGQTHKIREILLQGVFKMNDYEKELAEILRTISNLNKQINRAVIIVRKQRRRK